MLFVTVGIVILVASFVLALISLVREQRAVSAKSHKQNVQPETPEAKTEESTIITNHASEPATSNQPVLQEPEETVNTPKSDVILRLEEQIEKAKTTDQAASPEPEQKSDKNTDELWNKMMEDKEEDAAVPREPFPWEQSVDSVPAQTQTSQVLNKTDEPAAEPTTQSNGGVIRISDLVKKS